ncbi:MAG: lysophospholipid acyltransferase family protein [Xanthobacteraceae bacterium]
MQVIIRSVVFNLLFYLNLFFYLLAAMPTLLLPYRCVGAVAKSWARTSLRLLRVVCGIRADIRGLEKIPPGGLILASKHQSLWETFALLPLVDDPVFILKRELMWIPLFGWCLWKSQMIPVNRGARGPALAAMTERARIEVGRGRQIIIFPEGTRRAPGAEPQYKFGVAYLYAELGVPCVPVALNSGVFWPRRSFRRFPGTVRVEILDPIEPGLDKQVFADRLCAAIETATARLVEEGMRERERRAGGVIAGAESRGRP